MTKDRELLSRMTVLADDDVVTAIVKGMPVTVLGGEYIGGGLLRGEIGVTDLNLGVLQTSSFAVKPEPEPEPEPESMPLFS